MPAGTGGRWPPFLSLAAHAARRCCARPARRASQALCIALLVVAAELAAAAAAAAERDEVDVVRRIAAAGAIDVALERIAESQPRDPSAPRFSDWELLRLDLLWQRGRDAEVLKRVAAVRNLALPDRAAGGLWLTAARAAQRLGDAQQARAYYARYFLRGAPADGEYRAARAAVIDILLAEGQLDEAYRAMLRFQQDFTPLRAEEAERFVAALAGAGRAAEAVTWLPQLDKASAAAAMLRLRAGLISPDTAIAQARALLAKGVSEAALSLLGLAGAMQKNRAVELEALELRLDAAPAAAREAQERAAAGLWDAYVEVGQIAANQAQLLVGDDGAWVERALGMRSQQPVLARALLGSIASRSASEELRARAQLGLVQSLRDGQLASAALRLFAPPRLRAADLQPALRYELGALAAELRDAPEAVRFWRGLPPAPGTSLQEWRLRYTAALYAAGMVDEGLESAKSLITAPGSPAPATGRLAAIAHDALEAWHARPAERLFALLAPAAPAAELGGILLGLARAREALGEFRAAADAYLHAAALAESPQADPASLRARESGAVNLARAGLFADARATFQWLAAHAKDAAIRDSAARALRALKEGARLRP